LLSTTATKASKVDGVRSESALGDGRSEPLKALAVF
jgi:hypothetical protein